MKKLLLQSLTIFSSQNQKAKHIQFHPQMTVLTGENQVGKSRIVKSIYWTLGAEVEFDNRWKSLDIRSILQATIQGQEFIFYRSQKSVIVIDKNTGTILLRSGSITKELAPFYSNFFDFELKLTQSKSGESITPTPAFMFLPYYLDQEKGWVKLWTSFEALGQFRNWKKDLAAYHLGTKGKEHYANKHELDIVTEQIKSEDLEIKKIGEIIKDLQLKRKHSPIVIDLKIFSEEMKQITEDIYRLNTSTIKYRSQLTVLIEKKLEVNNQIAVAKVAYSELKQDFTQVESMPLTVNCPICGQEHTQDIIQRFQLIRDEVTCCAILEELNIEAKRIDDQIDGLESELSECELEAKKLQQLMQLKKDNVSIDDIIESRSEQRVISMASSNLADAVNQQKEHVFQKRSLEKKLRELRNKDRIDAITQYLQSEISENSDLMQVIKPTANDYKQGLLSINCDGSERPRAVLAAFFGYLSTIHKYGDARRFPIVIDSPFQQDQDPVNTEKILSFLTKKAMSSDQAVLATVSTYGHEFPGSTINISNPKYSLLNQSDYESNKGLIDFVMKCAIN